MDPLARTACWTAAIRAAESQRHDRLFHDPLAAALAGAAGMAMLDGADSMANVAAFVAIRTRFFDEFAVRAAAAGVRQVVLVAAGLDTRAYRLAWPEGTAVYEIDQPPLLARKARILATVGAVPQCRRVPVEADLSGDWIAALRDSGFDRHAPSLWIVEGLLFYLPQLAADAIIAALSAEAAPGSRLATDLISDSFLTSPPMRAPLEALARRGTPWLSASDEPEEWLARHGWTAHVAMPGEEGAGAGRWPYPVAPRFIRDMPHSWLVTAEKHHR